MVKKKKTQDEADHQKSVMNNFENITEELTGLIEYIDEILEKYSGRKFNQFDLMDFLPDDGSVLSLLPDVSIRKAYPNINLYAKMWLESMAIKVRKYMIKLFHQNPQLPEPPEPENEPLVDLQKTQQWCIKANVMRKPPQKIPPIDLEKGTWNNCKNLTRLRAIDNNSKKDGIPGTTKLHKDLKVYLSKERHGRPDIAETLSYKDGRITTSMSYQTMFLQK